MQRGEIYMVNLNPTAGHEQQGYRPVLIISPTNFNQKTKVPLVAPITTGGAFAKNKGFAVELTGIKTVGVVRCDQIRVLDLTERKAKLVESIDANTLNEVLAKVATLVS
jgi:mRNA interferase ChpB